MLGGVKNPGTITFKQGMTLGSLLDFCGGLTIRAKSNRIFIRRQTEIGPFDAQKDRDIPIQRGDSVRIELNADIKYVGVTGLVRTPANLEWVPGLSVLQVLKQAGGVIYPKAVIVVRSLADPKKKPLKIKWVDLEKDPSKDVNLQPNDIVDVVPK
jgi:protein involved in polysaccharide export with SLBB domain